MPSEEGNRPVRVTRVYQTQIHRCQKLENGMNGVKSRSLEGHGGLRLPQQRVDSMGRGGGPEILQGSDSFDKCRRLDFPHDRRSGHEHPGAEDRCLERSNADLRNRFAGQWQCPAFAWKALEAMPVRNLFRVTQSGKELKPLKDAGEAYIKTGDALLSVAEDKGLAEKKLVTIVLAFQRWRHTQLKNIIGQELRKVLEAAREDENVLASLSTELEYAEQQLATARANSSRLHSQLATAMITTIHENGNSADNTTVSKSDRQMTTLEGFKEADAEIHLRDHQIQQLKEKIRSMEDQIGRVDGQLGCLQSERSNLQAENTIVLRENRDLLEQLSSRDKEMFKQEEEMKRLKYLAARLMEQQNSKRHQIDLVAAEHSAEANTLREHLQQEFGANCSKEVELGTSAECCSPLEHGNGTLLLQLQEAEKRADLASNCAEELCTRLQFSTDDREDGSAASELVKHQKKLTQHVRELESTISATDTQPSSSHAGVSTVRNRMENSSGSKLGCRKADRRATPEFDQVYYTFPQDSHSGLLDTYPLSPTCTIDNGQLQWIAWKWRWAASSARAELLARKLHGSNQKKLGESQLDHKQQKVQELIQKMSNGNLTTCIKYDMNTSVAEHKLVPLVLSAWRAFTRTSALERKATSQSALLDKVLDALPWWIHKVRDRRQLQRSFFRWLVLTLNAHRHSNSQQDMKTKPRSKVVVEPVKSESSGTPVKPPSSAKLRLVMGPSDENAVTTQRRPHRTPAANAIPKCSLREHRNQLPSGTQISTLQALQTSLQQEVGELKKILCQEIQPFQRNSVMQNRVRLLATPTESSSAKQRRPDKKKVLKSVLSVCNNLALALTNVKGKLSPRIRANTLTVATKHSPGVFADTVNSCIRSEQTKINKGTGRSSLLKNVRRQFHESQSRKNSPRGRLVSGGPTLTNLQEPSPKKCHDVEMEKSTMKDICNNTTCSPAPVQEIGRYDRGAPCDKRWPPQTSDLVLDESFVNKFFGGGAKYTPLREEKLVESALARLVSTKISKLRGVQAV